MSNLDLLFEKTEQTIELVEVEHDKVKKPRSTCTVIQDEHIYRRAFSETQLLDILTLNMKEEKNRKDYAKRNNLSCIEDI